MQARSKGVLVGLSENIIRAILPKVQKAANTIGEEMVADVKQSLGRQYPPSGPPDVGPPARRTGHLQDGVGHSQETAASSVIETVYSARPEGNPMVPEWLERGTPTAAPRPYMKPARDRLAATIAARFAALMK